ncbi:P-loop containing nucleoside triphosphate hydrolase protein [Penicillium frequentans]|nr:P-loop containing nucleoside triphosphate hydrolase protein [Penicillium glabrum]
MNAVARAMISPDFENSRYIDGLVETFHSSVLQKQSLSTNNEGYMTVEKQDLPKEWTEVLNPVEECQKLFEGMVGCDLIKEQVLDDVKISIIARSRDIEVKDLIPFNYVFRGPPGTGKTTTARKIGHLFYHMGLLSSAEVIEASVTDLIGEYVGQTGPKVLELFDKALGKTLFIDEAYRLAKAGRSSHNFAEEAIGEIVGALTSPRYQQKIVIVLAGYNKEMNDLLSTNPGLRSRFRRVMTFESMSGVQCAQLLINLLRTQYSVNTSLIGTPTLESQPEMCNFFTAQSKKKGWGNGRDVESFSRDVFRAILRQADVEGDSLVVSRDQILSVLQKPKKSDKPEGSSSYIPRFKF